MYMLDVNWDWSWHEGWLHLQIVVLVSTRLEKLILLCLLFVCLYSLTVAVVFSLFFCFFPPRVLVTTYASGDVISSKVSKHVSRFYNLSWALSVSFFSAPFFGARATWETWACCTCSKLERRQYQIQPLELSQTLRMVKLWSVISLF